jgi:hypothetical protein
LTQINSVHTLNIPLHKEHYCCCDWYYYYYYYYYYSLLSLFNIAVRREVPTTKITIQQLHAITPPHRTSPM